MVPPVSYHAAPPQGRQQAVPTATVVRRYRVPPLLCARPAPPATSDAPPRRHRFPMHALAAIRPAAAPTSRCASRLVASRGATPASCDPRPVPGEAARDCAALLLPARERPAAPAGCAVEPGGRSADRAIEPHEPSHLQDLVVRGAEEATGDVPRSRRRMGTCPAGRCRPARPGTRASDRGCRCRRWRGTRADVVAAAQQRAGRGRAQD